MVIKFPAELPICAWRGAIEGAVRKSQAVIVCGETGSGKTTQIPKMLLEMGLGERGTIACTQPRRLPAVAMARRVAAELGTEPGGLVGFQHRFARSISPETRVKFMTDGVLLSELRRDRLLSRYSAVIVDEAHERSLNIDILLGFLRRIMARRRDLKVIVSSATLDVGLFAEFFGGAPVISVPGKMFPVEIRYSPPADPGDADLSDEILRATLSLPREGDILAFLPGERDIRDAIETLSQPGAGTEHDDIMPLMATLPPGEQQRIFRPSARRKIILSTNVAETSLTIPGIRYVIDSGLARVSRYIHRSGIQRLQVEPVSRASANQRAGRCGRTAPGICIRLYSEEDFSRRPEFTTPEILRSSLAGAVLSMLGLGIRDIESFPFVTRPEPAMLRNAVAELRELGAIDDDPRGGIRMTPVGRRLSEMPVEPRIGRMIIAAAKERSAASVIPIAAFLSCEDPRRHSIEDRDAARQAYAKFKAPNSDFAVILKMWQWWRKESEGLSQNRRRKLCKANYLSFNRMNEWQETCAQLARTATQMGIDADGDAGGDAGIHRALLAGLLSRIGKYHDGDRIYRGARGASFAISSSSMLKRATPPWIMAAEIVDTQRPFAATVSAIDGEWLEEIGAHLCRHAYRAPEWDPETGFVRALEDVTLFGLQIVSGRRCDYSRVDPDAARDIFIRRGLIDGDIPSPPKIVAANIEAVGRIRSAAGKARRPELFDEDALADYIGASMPKTVRSMPALRRWISTASAKELSDFRIDPARWLPENLPDDADFPDAVVAGGVRFPLEYRDGGGDDDGITCVARRSKAHLLRAWRHDWLVPGLLRDKLSWMISCLPSAQRRLLGPSEEAVARIVSHIRPGERPLAEAVAAAISEDWGIPVRPSAWEGIRIPAAYSVRFVIVDGPGRGVVAEGRDLDAVLAQAGIAMSPETGTHSTAPAKHSSWDFGTLAPETQSIVSGWKICRHTALKDCGDGVEIVALDTAAEAERVSRDGLARLLALSLGPRAASQLRLPRLPFQTALHLGKIGYSEKDIPNDILFSAVKEAAVLNRPPVFDRAAFESRARDLAGGLAAVLAKIIPIATESLSRAAAIALELEGDTRLPQSARDGISAQLTWLVFPRFLKAIPLARLRHYPRYFDAITVRMERARLNPSSDARRQAEAEAFWERYRSLVENPQELRFADMASLVEYRWMVEELRVSLFAQELKTPVPVSAKRLDALWAKTLRRGGS